VIVGTLQEWMGAGAFRPGGNKYASYQMVIRDIEYKPYLTAITRNTKD